MNADEVVRVLRSNAEVNAHAAAMLMAADLIESLQAQNKNLRNELCQQCGRYREAHIGACDACRWRENEDERV